MSMSTHIVGIKPPDDKWRQMKAVWDACANAGVPIPSEVTDYFCDDEPDSKGVAIDLDDLDGPHAAVSKYSAGGESGFEVNLKKLPPDITILRFTNNW